ARPRPNDREHARAYDRSVAEGNHLLDAGKTAQASAAFEHAIAQRPDGADALAGLGFVSLNKHQDARAVTYFQRALKTDAAHQRPLYGLGEAFRAQGNRRLAIDVFRRYLARFPRSREARTVRHQIEELERAVAKR